MFQLLQNNPFQIYENISDLLIYTLTSVGAIIIGLWTILVIWPFQQNVFLN